MDSEAQIERLRQDRSVTGIFLDFDGTLAPIVDDPAAAAIVSGAPEMLRRLAESYAVVALISGRGAADLSARVGAAGPRYFGLYGSEEMTAGGLVQSPMAAGWRKTARRLADEAAQLILDRGLAGCEAEYKDLALSLHYRHTGNPRPPEVLLEWAQAAAAGNGFRMGVGRMVLELKPKSVSKAGALQLLAVQCRLKNAVVAGDDAADVEMMQRAARLIPGVLLRVGVVSGEAPEGLAENSEQQVDSPQGVVSLLERLL